MPQKTRILIELPDDLSMLRFPKGVERRLHNLLDKQDSGKKLSRAERREAEGLVQMNDLVSLLRLRATRMNKAD